MCSPQKLFYQKSTWSFLSYDNTYLPTYISQVEKSTNEDASFFRTSDILKLSYIIKLRVNPLNNNNTNENPTSKR